MKLLLFAALLFLAACSKNIDVDQSAAEDHSTQQTPEVCTFGITNFNLSKRLNVQDFDPNMKKPAKPGNSGGVGTTTTPTTSSNAGVLFLDFDGHSVTGTNWNYIPTINCSPANLTTDAIFEIIDRVSNDYSPFNIVITTDEAVFNAASSTRRCRIIITESWEWYGQVGGVAYINSFANGSNNPAFVFSSLLTYNAKKIAEAVSHEAGHTLGLYHQARYDANCVLLSQYHSGIGDGETSWAPIMGVGYSKNLTLWHNGSNSQGCSVTQNDLQVIAGVVGYKADDYSNSTAGAAVLSGSLNGVISSTTDIDFFSLNTAVTRNVTAIPANVGTGNSGANLDILLKVYNSQGQLLHAVNDPASLSSSITINPGSYFVSVQSVANANTSNYGMLGLYSINVN
jgi:hypothetical protein